MSEEAIPRPCCLSLQGRSHQPACAYARSDGEGVKLDGGKPRTDLLPGDALLEVSAVLDYGAKKYAERNWEKGMAWGRLSSAALRHLWAWAGGEDQDSESGHRHLAHFACCALMLLALVRRGVGTDDRQVLK